MSIVGLFVYRGDSSAALSICHSTGIVFEPVFGFYRMRGEGWGVIAIVVCILGGEVGSRPGLLRDPEGVSRWSYFCLSPLGWFLGLSL